MNWRNVHPPRNFFMRFIIALCLVPWSLPAFGYGIPDWFRVAAHETLPTYPADTKAVVLLDEEITTISDNGEIHTTYRRVVKILTTEGRDFSTAEVHFDSQTKLTFF